MPREWARYQKRLSLLLSRPHAYVFLHLGGLYWRLALLFGERYIQAWKTRLLGPSEGLIHRRMTSSSIYGHWSDVVTETEKKVLLGLCRCKTTGVERTWFPPPELLIKHRFHDGEWSQLEEYFLRERYDSLQRGESTYRPLTSEEWEVELVQYRPGQLLRDSFVVVHSPAAHGLLSDARTEFGGAWDRATLEEINRSLVHEDEVDE